MSKHQSNVRILTSIATYVTWIKAPVWLCNMLVDSVDNVIVVGYYSSVRVIISMKCYSYMGETKRCTIPCIHSYVYVCMKA